MAETYLRIEKIGIAREYGFVRASFIEASWVYGNGKPVKNSKNAILGAYNHSTCGIDYAIFCGIRDEWDLKKKLEGKMVNYSYNVDEHGYTIIGLGKPKDFEKNGNLMCGKEYFWIPIPEEDDEINWDEAYITRLGGN